MQPADGGFQITVHLPVPRAEVVHELRRLCEPPALHIFELRRNVLDRRPSLDAGRQRSFQSDLDAVALRAP